MPAVALSRQKPGQRHLFTVEEYHRLGEAGFLGKRGLELLEGEIIHMSPIGFRHGRCVTLLLKHFVMRSKDRYDVHPGNPINLDAISEPQPDIMLTQLDAGVEDQKLPVPEAAYLVIEVADASLRYDRGRKQRAYARAGIAELWIVNLRENTVEMHREPGGEKYRWTHIARGREKIAPESFPDVTIAVEKIIP